MDTHHLHSFSSYLLQNLIPYFGDCSTSAHVHSTLFFLMAVCHSAIRMYCYLPVITFKLFPRFLVQNLILVNNHTTYPTKLKCFLSASHPFLQRHTLSFTHLQKQMCRLVMQFVPNTPIYRLTGWTRESKLPGFRLWFCFLLSEQPWGTDSPSLCLSFLIS